VGTFVGREGRLIDYNAAFKKSSGYTDEELKGKAFLDFVHPDDHAMVLEKYQTKYSEEELPLVYEIRGMNKKGESIPLELSVSTYKQKGRVIGIEVIHRDITERKKAEEELRRFSTAVRTSLDGIITGDLNGNITDVNDAVLRMYGDSNKGDLIGKNVLDFVVEGDRTRALRDSMESMKTGQGKTIEYRALTKNGTEIPIEITTAITRDEQGEPIGFVDIVRNMSERKNAELELQMSERKYRELADQLPVIVYEIDSKGKFTFVNEKGFELTGYSHEDIEKGLNILQVVVDEDQGKAKARIQRTLSGEKMDYSEYTLLKKDGSTFPAIACVSAIVREGKTIGLRGTVIDITERKKMEKALLQSQQKFEQLFMSNPEAAVYVDPNERVLNVNPRFTELFGYSADEANGRFLDDFVVPEDRKKEALMLAQKGKEGYVYHETVRKNKKGSLIPVALSSAPIVLQGQHLGDIVLYKDITDRKKAEEERRETMEKVQMMNEKLRVVGGLTRHDVRNKLTAVVGNAYLLKKRVAGDPDATECLNGVEAAVRESERVFDFAGAYEKLGVEQLAYVDAKKIVDEAVGLFPDLRGVKIANDCGGLTLLADSLLGQLFYNLIDDSLKYGEKLTQIRVRYEEFEDKLKLIYEDDGVGIPRDAKSKLFTEGFTTGKGSGYGLYLIGRMMEVYGWTIDETGTHGKGAQFTINIPKAKPDGRPNYKLG
jgi:PAS domain S-box-containing protein